MFFCDVMYKRKWKGISVFFLLFIYLLSLGAVILMQTMKEGEVRQYDDSFFLLVAYGAVFLNGILLFCNALLIQNIFTNRDKGIFGVVHAFVYLLLNNKVWFFDGISHYLLGDFFILISFYFIQPQETKKSINMLVFYLAAFLGGGFLIGINIFYALIVPVLILNIFLVADWKTWVIFMLGFLIPVYFYVSIGWLLEGHPLDYLRDVLAHSFDGWQSLSISDFSMTVRWRWGDLGIVLIVALSVLAGMKEAGDVYHYSSKERRWAVVFFLLMLVSFVNYILMYIFYDRCIVSVIALPFAYYVGNFINKVYSTMRYFILFLLFVLTVFL